MKNRYLIWMVMLLVIANLAAIAVFFLGKAHHPRPPGQPSEFIIRELGFNEDQQKSYMELVKDHRSHAEGYREKIMKAKNHFFDLLQQPSVSDSTKQAALKDISKQTEELDLITFNHFQKLRVLCTEAQQKKFDNIIHKVLGMMTGPRPPGGGRSGMPPSPPPF